MGIVGRKNKMGMFWVGLWRMKIPKEPLIYTSLVEYKLPDEGDESPLKDASYEKNYIRGRYGAIPFIGDFNQIFRKE